MIGRCSSLCLKVKTTTPMDADELSNLYAKYIRDGFIFIFLISFLFYLTEL
jgi:hypothetical protein